MTMAIRTIDAINSDLDGLNVSTETLRTLTAMHVDTRTLIEDARNDSLWHKYMPEVDKPEANKLMSYVGINAERAAEIIEALDEAGFILHESESSHSVRKLLAAVLGSPLVFIEKYESLEEVSPQGLQYVNDIVNAACPLRFRRIFKLYTGLEDGHCYTIQECVDMTGTVSQVVQQTHRRTLSRLRHQDTILKLKAAVFYSEEELTHRIRELESTILAYRHELDVMRESKETMSAMKDV